MKIKQLLILSASALLLTGIGISAKTNVANASQPPRVIRYLSNRNNHCYYGYMYKRDQYKTYPKEYYVRGYMPRYLRHHNKRTFLFSPYYNSKVYGTSPTLRRGRTTYYKKLINHPVRNKIYNYLCINQHDIEKRYAKRNARYYRWAYRTVRKDKRLIRKHRRNHKYVAKLRQKMFNPEVVEGIKEGNHDLFKHPKAQKAYLNHKYFPKLFKHHRKHYRRNRRGHHESVGYIQKQMADATVNDINRAREEHGESALSDSNSYLNNLNLQRIKQIPTDFSHDGVPDDVGENIAYTTLGNTSMAGDPHHFDNHNGKQMADEVMDSFMNYDGNQGNVHRDNILDSDYTSEQVAVWAPHGKHGNFYLVEDFQ